MAPGSPTFLIYLTISAREFDTFACFSNSDLPGTLEGIGVCFLLKLTLSFETVTLHHLSVILSELPPLRHSSFGLTSVLVLRGSNTLSLMSSSLASKKVKGV